MASKEHLGVVNKELKELGELQGQLVLAANKVAHGEHQVRLVLEVNKVLKVLGELQAQLLLVVNNNKGLGVLEQLVKVV